MSEVTTGAVSLSLIGAPLAIGAACIGAMYFASKYCVKQYEKMHNEIDKSNARLKWLDKQTISSPVQIMEEAKHLQKMVIGHPAFIETTQGLNIAQKEILAGVIVTQNSPLKAYVPEILKTIPEKENAFDTALKQGAKNLAADNLKFVTNTIKGAAKSTGFVREMKILKQTKSLTDIVFIDKFNRRFTAYCKLDKLMNPSIALDLEGFGSENNACQLKMDEIVKYLQENGVPFTFKRIKHNQPMGVLRNILNKKNTESQKQEIQNYLQGRNHFNVNKDKQKLL